MTTKKKKKKKDAGLLNVMMITFHLSIMASNRLNKYRFG